MPTYYPPQGMPQVAPNTQAGQNDIQASIQEDTERRKQEYLKKRQAQLQAREEEAQAKHAKNQAKINAITGAIGAIGSIGGQIYNRTIANKVNDYIESDASEVSAPDTDATKLVPPPGQPQELPLNLKLSVGGLVRKFNQK